MIAMSTKAASMPRPMRIFRERGSRNARPRPAAATGAGPGAGKLLAARSVPMPTAIWSCLLTSARVEEHVDEVGNQVRGQHGERDDQEQALQQRVVVVGHGVDEQ